ncbi:MAG: nuclease [Bacteroides sp. SM23_62]|nr:MAG: nuclease [Bacteroides sp. SM23_62]
MNRDITQKLIKWKGHPDRKPLIIRGARQVGKSYSVMEFGQKYFQGNIHLLDFEKHPEWIQVFERNLDAKRIISDLEVMLGSGINIGKDLLFFDEIQTSPRAIMSLRYFYEQIPDLHVIAAGSLLEFALKDVSFPVGRIQLLNMYPMTFAEFLDATGNKQASDIILSPAKELTEAVHQFLLDQLRKYFFIGGMPECVLKYTQTGSLHQVLEIQTNLINTFRLDFPKYAKYSDKQCINAVVVSTAKSVGQKIKYARLTEDFSNPTIKKAFDLLCQARFLSKVRSVSPAGLPLVATASERTFKALLIDIGLMQNLCGLAVNTEYSQSDLLSIYRGALAEQFVGQELIAALDREVYFWSREAKSSTAEVDYIIALNNDILPLEVKSGVAGRLKSLHLLLKTYPNCSQGFVFSGTNYAKLPDQKLVFLPLYYVSSLVRNRSHISPKA